MRTVEMNIPHILMFNIEMHNIYAALISSL